MNDEQDLMHLKVLILLINALKNISNYESVMKKMLESKNLQVLVHFLHYFDLKVYE